MPSIFPVSGFEELLSMSRRCKSFVEFTSISLILSSILVQPLWSAPQKTANAIPSQEASTTAQKTINDQPYYPSFFNETISKIYDAASKKDFSKAAQVLLDVDENNVQALDFWKDRFFNESHSQDTFSKVSIVTDKLKKNIQSYINLQSSLASSLKSFSDKARGSNIQATSDQLDKTVELIKQFLSLRDSVIQENDNLLQTFESLKNIREVQDASYLSFVTKFIAGTGRTENTGLVGAMNMQWLEIEQQIVETLFKSVESHFNNAASLLDQKDFLKHGYDFKKLLSFIDSVDSISPLVEKIIDLGKNMGLDAKSKLYQKVLNYEKSFKAMSNVSQKTRSIVPFMEDISQNIHQLDEFIDKSVADTAQDLRDSLDQVSQFYLQKSSIFVELGDKSDLLLHEPWINETMKLPEECTKWEKILDSYVESCEYISKTCTTKSSETTVAAGQRLISAGKQMLVEGKEKYNALMSLIPDTTQEDAKQYPTKVLKSVNTFRQSMALDVSTLKKGSDLLGTGSLSQKSNIQYMQKKIKESMDNIQKLSSQTDSLVQQAQSQQREALQAQSQVDIYFNRAKSAYNSGDFATARNNLEKAANIYESLIDNLRRDVTIQEETYDKITALKQDVAERQQPLLIKEIRGFKNNAKVAYYAGNFDEASNQITQADDTMRSWARFMDMEIEEDEELERLKILINTALAIKSGKELNPNDPLYPEMSQILSISNQLYQGGQDLMNSGKTDEGKKLLSKAKDKLNELKIVYPRNQQANLLSMRIDQIMDLKQFNETFKTRVDELKKINYDNRDQLAQESYSDLQDLYQLSPSYPGLSDFIYQVEISLGLKQKVVETTSSKGSNDDSQIYARQAQAALASAGRDTMALENARKLANQALAINPSNDLAISVLDEVALRTGSQAAVVLSAADEAKYQQAIKYLQNGNVIAANSSLQELLQKPSNRRSAKVQKLQSRIKGMLN